MSILAKTNDFHNYYTTTNRAADRGERWEPSVLDAEPASGERSNVMRRDQIVADA